MNTVTNATYIGSSVNIEGRLKAHRYHLRTNNHFNVRLQGSWKTHGERAFIFEELLACDRANLPSKEQQFIDAYIEHDMKIYNQAPSFQSRLGFSYKHPPEVCSKIGDAHRGKIRSVDERAKQGASRRGIKFSQEWRAKLSASRMGNTNARGCIWSPEQRAKLSASLIGNTNSLGIKHTPETRAKMSAAHTGLRGRIVSPETRAKISKARKEFVVRQFAGSIPNVIK